MKFSDVFQAIKPFASVAASFIPGGPAVVGLLNSVLPEDKKLPSAATGQQIMDAHSSLTSDQRSSLAEKKIDLKIAQEEGWTERYKAMTAADGHSTRPKIALEVARAFLVCYILIGAAMAWAIFEEMVSLESMWPTLLAFLGIPLGILNKYFGELRKEQSNRLQVKQPSILDLFINRK
jgi:hypothetical protein